MSCRAHVSMAAVTLIFVFSRISTILAQSGPPAIFDPAESLRTQMESEKSKGEWIFYHERFVDADNQLAQYQGSIFAAVQSMKIEECQVNLDTVVVDHFSGIVGNSGTGEQQDTTRSEISFTVTQAIVDTLQLIEARPAQLRRTTRAICDENPSCELTWIQVKDKGRRIRERVTTNGQLDFSGFSGTATFPVSSPDAGATVMRNLRALATSKCW